MAERWLEQVKPEALDTAARKTPAATRILFSHGFLLEVVRRWDLQDAAGAAQQMQTAESEVCGVDLRQQMATAFGRTLRSMLQTLNKSVAES